jgi:hypothetical protein
MTYKINDATAIKYIANNYYYKNIVANTGVNLIDQNSTIFDSTVDERQALDELLPNTTPDTLTRENVYLGLDSLGLVGIPQPDFSSIDTRYIDSGTHKMFTNQELMMKVVGIDTDFVNPRLQIK